MKPHAPRTRTFNVHIPSLDGDGIAEILPVEVRVFYDPEIGEEILTRESLELIETTKARRLGLLLPVEIKALRKRLGLTQAQLSVLLQLGRKSYTRWETGRGRPSRSTNVLLCALRDGRIDISYLKGLRHQLKPRRTPAGKRTQTRWRTPNAAAA